MAKVSKISSLSHKSTAFKESLEYKFGNNASTPQRNDTSWNSTLTTILAILKKDINKLNEIIVELSHLKKTTFSPRDWSMLQEAAAIL